VRLLCTYLGPGTEWLVDEGVDRLRLYGASARGPARPLTRPPIRRCVIPRLSVRGYISGCPDISGRTFYISICIYLYIGVPSPSPCAVGLPR